MSHRRFVVGLIGVDLGPSLSPALHERAADELGLRYVYQLIDLDTLGFSAEDVGDLVRQAHRLGFAGLNITHPCKQTVVRHLDQLSPDATALGTVNTVVFGPSGAVGHNTDWSGFAAGFGRGLTDAKVDDVVLLGAGGAGTAVAYAIVRLGARRLTVVDVVLEGCRTLNGGGMVVFQAAEAFRLITGQTPDADRMYSHFMSMTQASPAAHPMGSAIIG